VLERGIVFRLRRELDLRGCRHRLHFGAVPLDRLDPRGAFAAIALMLDRVGLATSARRLNDAIRSLDADPERTAGVWEELVLDACQVKE
jgi:hypothetical protein